MTQWTHYLVPSSCFEMIRKNTNLTKDILMQLFTNIVFFEVFDELDKVYSAGSANYAAIFCHRLYGESLNEVDKFSVSGLADCAATSWSWFAGESVDEVAKSTLTG